MFPEDQPGIYINKLQLGPIRADLSANYDYSGANKIDVSFIDIAAFLGPLQLIRKVPSTTLSMIQSNYTTAFCRQQSHVHATLTRDCQLAACTGCLQSIQTRPAKSYSVNACSSFAIL